MKTGNPLFLGYVTPPSLDIGVLGDTLASITNQNVSFSTVSPIGTALETSVISWLHEIVGWESGASGILTSGGSEANLYALAVARRRALGPAFSSIGISAGSKPLRLYCSEETHHSIDKAATILGIGRDNVVRISVDADHRIDLIALTKAIEQDLADEKVQPFALIGNAGTRLCCAFDSVADLGRIARQYGLWLHIDAAYGGFLRLARVHPPELEALNEADSLTIDPHKLLFVPYDCGALLVKKMNDLANTFGGAEGEYIESTLSEGMVNFANLGLQLGRSMRALKVWLTLKRFGAEAFGLEFERLLSLATKFKELLAADDRFELLGPVRGTAVCFRWKRPGWPIDRLNALNQAVRNAILREGTAFIDQVSIGGRVGMRVCMTNFRTQESDIERLLSEIARIATGELW